MRDAYIQNLIKLSSTEKSQINSIYNAALKASQEMFLESSLTHSDPVFDVLEGTVKYNISAGKGIFIPNKHLKNLLSETIEKKKSVLLEKNLSRFTALLMHAYKDFNEKNTDAYKLWLLNGHTGNESEFLNWISKKSDEEKN